MTTGIYTKIFAEGLKKELCASVTDNTKLLPVLPTGVHHRCEADADIIFWRNGDIPKNGGNLFPLVFAVIFAVAFVLYFSYQIFTGGLENKTLIEQIAILIFYIVCWLPLAGALSSLQSLTWFEAVKISDADITVIHSGRHAPQNKRLGKNIVVGIAFLRYQLDGREIVPSLNILYADQKAGFDGVNREILATWMRTKEKHQLFLFLQHILQERKWNIEYRLQYQPK